jgi:hypothetical protein
MATHILCDWEALAVLTFRTPGPAFLETRQLFWHLHQQDTALWSKYRATECLSKALHKREKHVEVQGSVQCLPYCIVLYCIVLYYNKIHLIHHLIILYLRRGMPRLELLCIITSDMHIDSVTVLGYLDVTSVGQTFYPSRILQLVI